MKSSSLFSLCLLTALPLSMAPSPSQAQMNSSQAQMNSQPFSFGSVVNGPINGGSSVGMSTAGRQAIINEKLFGARPHAILVGPSGEILNVERGPGNIAVVRQESNPVIPQFRGRTGGFGFSMAFGGASSGYGLGFGQTSSIDSWVAMASDGWAAQTSGTSSTSATIESWTSSVLAN